MIMSYFSFLESAGLSQYPPPSPPVIFIRSFPLHTYHYLSPSLRTHGRRLIYRLPENRLVRRRRHCNDCNEVRPKSGTRRIDSRLLQSPQGMYEQTLRKVKQADFLCYLLSHIFKVSISPGTRIAKVVLRSKRLYKMCLSPCRSEMTFF